MSDYAPAVTTTVWCRSVGDPYFTATWPLARVPESIERRPVAPPVHTSKGKDPSSRISHLAASSVLKDYPRRGWSEEKVRENARARARDREREGEGGGEVESERESEQGNASATRGYPSGT